MEINGTSILRDQKKEKYHMAFSLKRVAITNNIWERIKYLTAFMGCLLCVRDCLTCCVWLWWMLSSTVQNRPHDSIHSADLKWSHEETQGHWDLRPRPLDSRVLAVEHYTILPPRQIFYISGPLGKGERKASLLGRAVWAVMPDCFLLHYLKSCKLWNIWRILSLVLRYLTKDSLDKSLITPNLTI